MELSGEKMEERERMRGGRVGEVSGREKREWKKYPSWISITESKRERNNAMRRGLIIYQLKVQLLTALANNFKWLKGPRDTEYLKG